MRILVLLVMMFCTPAWAKSPDTEKSSEAPSTVPNTVLAQPPATADMEHTIQQRRQPMREEVERAKEQTNLRTKKIPNLSRLRQL